MDEGAAMKITIQSPNQPSNNLCIIWDNSANHLCSIDEGTLISDVFTSKQTAKYTQGHWSFNLNKAKLREHCTKWFQIGQ